MKNLLHDSFIPYAGNDYLPTALRRVALLGMLGLVLLSFLAANLQALLWQSSSWLVGAVLPAVVVSLTNDERDQQNLVPLIRNADLDAAAQLKADDMAEYSYFAHYSPAGVSPWYWFGQVGYSYVHAGENLAVHFSDSGEVVEAWMNSPGHRANIINSNYRQIGVGTARGTYDGYNTVFVVQLFGTPAVPAVGGPALSVPPVVVPAVAPRRVVSTAPAPREELAVAGEEASVVAGVETSLPSRPLPTPAPAPAPAPVLAIPVSSELLLPADMAPIVVYPEVVEKPVAPVIAETVVGNDIISLYSTMISTSTNLQPAPVAASASTVDDSTPYLARLATEPSRLLQLIYLILGTMVASILFISVIIEWRRQHPRRVVYGVLLLLLMSGLFYLHLMVTAGAQIV